MRVNKFFLYFCTLAFICCFFYSNKIYAYDCYAASNAKTVAPDNGTACANKYIIKNANFNKKKTKGNIELTGKIMGEMQSSQGVTHILLTQVKNIGLVKHQVKKIFLQVRLQTLIKFLIRKKILMQT